MKGEFLIHLQVTAVGAHRFAGTCDISGNPLCCYGVTAEEAEQKVKGTALRLLGSMVEQGRAELVALRFKTTGG